MDIKAKIDELAKKISSDKALQDKFAKDPIGAIEQLIGIPLPKDQIKAIADGVKTKINLDGIGEKLGGLGSLFGK